MKGGYQCSKCKQHFNKVYLLWQHRKPLDGPVSPEVCLTPEQLKAKGWKFSNGRWFTYFKPAAASGQRIAKLLHERREIKYAIQASS